VQLRIPEEATEWARRFLASHDVNDFVVVHNREAREAARMREVGSNHSDPYWNDMRNFRLEPVVDAALRALPKDTTIVRIGAAGAQIGDRKRFIDTMPLALGLPQQLALLSLSLAFIGGPSGPISFAWVLKKPILMVNNPLIGGFLTQAGVPMVGL